MRDVGSRRYRTSRTPQGKLEAVSKPFFASYFITKKPEWEVEQQMANDGTFGPGEWLTPSPARIPLHPPTP